MVLCFFALKKELIPPTLTPLLLNTCTLYFEPNYLIINTKKLHIYNIALFRLILNFYALMLNCLTFACCGCIFVL